MTLIDYFPKLIDKRVPISALKIPPRVFLNWKKEGVIDIKPYQTIVDVPSINRKTTRKWAYLDAFETLWLLIVKELRKFNLDLKTIIQLKKYLFELDDLKQYASQFDSKELNEFMNLNLSDEIKQSGGIEKIDLDVFLKNIQLLEDEYKNFLNRIGNLFMSVLIHKHLPSILIYKNKDSGQIQFEIFEKEYIVNSFSKEYLYLEMQGKFSSEVFINIPLINLFVMLFEDENFDSYNSDFEIYNYREQKVLELLRNNDYKEIIIKKGNDGFLHLESKSQLEFKNEKAKEIRKIMGLKEYDRIELIQRNDKHIIINKTNREKI